MAPANDNPGRYNSIMRHSAQLMGEYIANSAKVVGYVAFFTAGMAVGLYAKDISCRDLIERIVPSSVIQQHIPNKTNKTLESQVLTG